MTEEQYLDTVERIQKAMAIEPFQPSVIDVVKLLSDWRTLVNENERLRAIEEAARNLDAHQNEGYATLVSYLIRLHEALEAPPVHVADRMRKLDAEG